MALIECKECGKRISDTTRVCIHCGAPTCVSKPDAVGDSENTQKQSQNGVAHDVENKQKESEAQAEKTEPKKIFQNLDKDTQCELEKEFWKVDKRAKKYKRRTETGKFIMLLALGYYIVGLISLLWIMSFGKEIGNGVPDWLTPQSWVIYRVLFPENIPLMPIILEVIGISSMIVGGVRLKQRQGKKEVVYKKRFQAWLLMEKNIEYIPQFFMAIDRSVWNHTDINKKL